MSGGGGNGIGQGMVNAGVKMGGTAPTPQANVGYTPAPTMPTYQPAFNAQQTAAPRLSPQVAQQQFMQQRMMQQAPQQMPAQMMRQAPQQQGLQMLLNNMMSRYGMQPQRAPMPQFQSQALQYRPDMTGAQQNLGRVAKSVVLQQKEAAEAELEAMRAAQAAETQNNNPYGGG